MALSQAEQEMLNEAFMRLDWSDPHAALVAAGASDAMMRALISQFKQRATASMQSMRDHAIAEIARLNS